jgi:hypothetical protein
MLRCPKCSRIYQDGSQRFCVNDGGRLLSVGAAPSAAAEQHAANGDLSRRTAPGELMFETVITSKNDFVSDFQAFGIHDSKTPEKVASDFRLFDRSASEKKNFKTAAPVPNEAMTREYIDDDDSELIDAGEHKGGGFDAPFVVVCLLGAILFLTGLAFAAAYFFREHETARQFIETSPSPASADFTQKTPSEVAPSSTSNVPNDYAVFQNSKEKLEGKLAEKFVGFSIAYPKSWQKNAAAAQEGNFLDAANRISTGVPIEQILISWYGSEGTFEADRENFPKIAQKLNNVYKLPDYKQISEGAIEVNAMPAYEVRFESVAADKRGEEFRFYGRTILLPVGRPDMRSGLLITQLGTSLAPELTSAADVGVKGELAKILATLRFED